MSAQLGLALCGAGIAAGVLLMAGAVTGLLPPFPSPARLREVTGRLRRHATIGVAAVAGGLAVGWVTGWPVAALLTLAAIWWLPGLLGPDRSHTSEVARIEALAAWAEQLRDTLSGAAGIEQTIRATTATAPEAIAPQLHDLEGRLAAGWRLPRALRALADDLADPGADLIVGALDHAARSPAADLAPLLSGLANAARDQAAMRIRAAADRARTRTSVRVITAATLTIAAALTLISGDYLAPYDSMTGQLVLALAGACFAAGLVWLRHLARGDQPARHLTHTGKEAS